MHLSRAKQSLSVIGGTGNTPYAQSSMPMINNGMKDDLRANLRTLGARSSQHSYSPSMINMSDKFQRSQKNIERKVKEDFDRLQKQIKNREEKEKSAQTNVQASLEERLYKVNLLNKRAESNLDKVKRQQRRVEIRSVKEFKKDQLELEEKLKNDAIIDNKQREVMRKQYIENKKARSVIQKEI